VASVISLGLSSADLALFQRSLITGYNLKVTVQILDLNHRYITDVSSLLVDGQVNHSYFEAISYSATMTLMDPDNLVGFDTSSPSDNALYADRMIKIVYSVYSDLLPRWVDVPIFTGGVTKVTRDDAILSVECQGKEALWSAPAVTWAARTYAKNSLLTTTIRDVMARYTGETRFDFPNWTNKLSRDFSVTQETVPWDFARSLQGSRTVRQLFYDGRGVLRLRGAPNGVRRQLAEIIEDDNITTQAQADAQAEQTLASISVTNVGFDFDSFPIPHLEPGDIFHLSTRDASINLRAVEFSIPLRAGTSQSNGTTRKLSANSARLRRK
jgi:hypothetical protein